MQDLVGKVAFITGGASGIGLGLAQVFLRAGMKVVVADVSQEYLDDAGAQLAGSGSEFVLLPLDVSDRAAFAAAADAAERRFGKVHVVCNNAGISTVAPIGSATYADWDRALSVNLFGVINGIVTFIPRIQAHAEGGHIVNTSSMAGIVPLPDTGGLYTTTKFAVRGLSESLRLSLAAVNIGVSALFPGLTRTRMLDGARASSADELAEGFRAATKFAMDPLIVGAAVLGGIRNNDAYILPHAEFIDEVQALHAELIGSFRTDIDIDPGRAAFEAARRKMTDELRAAADNLR